MSVVSLEMSNDKLKNDFVEMLWFLREHLIYIYIYIYLVTYLRLFGYYDVSSSKKVTVMQDY